MGGIVMPKPRDSGSNVTPETVQSFTRELVISKRELEEAQGRHRAILKRAKASGINNKAMTEHLANRKLDSDEVTRHYRDVFYYGAVNGAPYAQQQDMFPTSGMDLHVTEGAEAEHQEFEAGEAGYLAGRAGKPVTDCPFPVTSPLSQVWSRRWHDGQASLAAELGPGETAPVGRARRGRVNTPGEQPEVAAAAQ